MTAPRARLRVRQLAAIAAVAGVVTPVFNVLTSAPTPREAIQGVVDAVLISLLVGGYLTFVRDGWLHGWFRQLGFVVYLALSTAIVLALFFVDRALGQVATTLDPRRFVKRFGDRRLVYALPFFAVVAGAVFAVVQMNRMIGTNELRYFVAGVYHRPRSRSVSSSSSISWPRRSGPSGSAARGISSCSAASSMTSPRRSWTRAAKTYQDRGPGAACMIPSPCRTS